MCLEDAFLCGFLGNWCRDALCLTRFGGGAKSAGFLKCAGGSLAHPGFLKCASDSYAPMDRFMTIARIVLVLAATPLLLCCGGNTRVRQGEPAHSAQQGPKKPTVCSPEPERDSGLEPPEAASLPRCSPFPVGMGLWGGRWNTGGIAMSDDQQADARMEQIILAIKEKDGVALKSLFSKKALGEASDFESDVDYLFSFLQGTIDTWKRDGLDGDESIDYGKQSSMLRYSINVNTDKGIYELYVIDYVTDTINPDNQGVYMLEVKLAGSPNTGSWQQRMRAGLYLH